jgi:hypothetical protein
VKNELGASQFVTHTHTQHKLEHSKEEKRTRILTRTHLVFRTKKKDFTFQVLSTVK